MYNLLSNIKDHFKRQRMFVDHPVFRIHCVFTAVLLITFSVIITWTQFFGQPIKCIGEGVPAPVINGFCWISGTFTIPDVGHGGAHYGVGQNESGDEKKEKHFNYYRWVPAVLFLQALLCTLPKWLWNTWEHEMMSTIVDGLNSGLHSEDETNQKKSNLIEYLIRHLNQHNRYALRYWLCEILCLANVIFQMFSMNWFFQGDFMSYGLQLLALDDIDQAERRDHMISVFPRVTKCTFKTYGPSQDITTRDFICILPLNVVNEKTYMFLWFWFIIVGGLCASVLVYRLIIIVAPSLRSMMMAARNRMIPFEAVKSVTLNISVGDWWVLYMVGRNVNPALYKDVIVEFSKKDAIVHSDNHKVK